MAGTSSFWVVLFAFACLYFAMRDGRANAALALMFGALAIATQASGLIALPLAAVFCALRGRRAHALLYGISALALWAVYFIGFARPAHHPAFLHALAHPLDALGVFLVVTGGLFPSVAGAIALAVVLLIVLALALRQGLWRRSPTLCAWIAFILASAAAITVGRAGFGVAHSSRYAISCTSVAAPDLISWWTPWDGALVTGPGTPIRGRLSRSAQSRC